jgi:energy-coupling factor transport system ATP-binding protein
VGKSTLARLIAGFARPEKGCLLFEGNDLADYSIKERADRIGYVMQNPNQMISFPQIFDEAAFALRNRGMPENEIRDRVYESLRICGLYPFRNWPVNTQRPLGRADILVLIFAVLLFALGMLITFRDGDRFYNPFAG